AREVAAAERARQAAELAHKRAAAARHAAETGTITAQVIAQRTIDTLLTGGTVAHLAGNYGASFASTWLVYDDGHGAAKISVSLDFTGAAGSAACQISTCTNLPDGSTLAVYRGSDRPGQPYAQPKMWSVSLLRHDGMLVTFTEWNA